MSQRFSLSDVTRTQQRLRERIQQMALDDAGHGYDPFGAHLDWVAWGTSVVLPFYAGYFRVSSHGAQRLPGDGPVIVAANHSGTLPVDAIMLWMDLIAHTEPPRLPRVVMDHFVMNLPWVNTWFTRTGAVGGSRGNVRWILEHGGLLVVFPEGVPGIAKPFSQRYQLQQWREGHVEFAIRHGAAVVPTAIIGAEEQMPQVATIPWVNVFGAPHFPIPATLLPLPVHIHIHYGEPIRFDAYLPEAANDAAVLEDATARVKDAVHALIEQGLEQRRGIFW